MKEKPNFTYSIGTMDRLLTQLARPDKYNAMNVQMITELIEVFAWTAEHQLVTKVSC